MSYLVQDHHIGRSTNSQKVIGITQNKPYQIIPQRTTTLPIATRALITTSTNLPPPQTLVAELVGDICKPGLVVDSIFISVLIAGDVLISKVPFPACVLVADDLGLVVTMLLVPVGLAVPTTLPEVAAEVFAPAPHRSLKLPILGSEPAKKQSPAPIGWPLISEHE
jgi:hypothetical protein